MAIGRLESRDAYAREKIGMDQVRAQFLRGHNVSEGQVGAVR